MVEKEKSSFGGGIMSNALVAGIDLGDTKSLATVLSPSGDVTDRFSFAMTEEGYMFFASRVPRDARIAFEATGRAYPISRVLILCYRRAPEGTRLDCEE